MLLDKFSSKAVPTVRCTINVSCVDCMLSYLLLLHNSTLESYCVKFGKEAIFASKF